MTENETNKNLMRYVGKRTPGGCDYCEAFQTMEKVEWGFLLEVHHDDDCPRYIDYKQRTTR